MEKLIKKTNVLLAKDDVGKPKPCTVKLPATDHAYGKPDRKELYGAGVITSSWHTSEASKPAMVGKDFKKLNKMHAK